MKYPPGGQRTVSKANYWAARGLADFHKQLKKRLHEVEAMIAMFLGEPEDPDSPGYYGHLSDGLWDGSDIDEIMNRLCIGLEDEPM
jgi:hypothetical protein